MFDFKEIRTAFIETTGTHVHQKNTCVLMIHKTTLIILLIISRYIFYFEKVLIVFYL